MIAHSCFPIHSIFIGMEIPILWILGISPRLLEYNSQCNNKLSPALQELLFIHLQISCAKVRCLLNKQYPKRPWIDHLPEKIMDRSFNRCSIHEKQKRNIPLPYAACLFMYSHFFDMQICIIHVKKKCKIVSTASKQCSLNIL